MKLPQLSLRDLFCLVLVVAMGFGWFVDRTMQYYGNVYSVEQWSATLQLTADMEKAANAAGYKFEHTGSGYRFVPLTPP